VHVDNADPGGVNTLSWGAAETGVKSTAQNIDLAVSNFIHFYWTVAGGSAIVSGATAGIAIKPDTKGQFILANGSPNGNMSNSVDTYLPLVGSMNTPNTTVDAWVNIASGDFSITGASARVFASPGTSPNSYTTTLREGTVGAMADCSVPFQIVLTAATQWASGTGNRPVPEDFTCYDTEMTPYSTPTAVRIMISYIGYIAPSASAFRLLADKMGAMPTEI